MLSRPNSRCTRAALLASALGLALLAPAPGASADPTPDAAVRTTVQSTTRDASGATKTVTLITGDAVTVTTGPDGKTAVTTQAAPGTSPTFRTESIGADTYVYPETAEEAISSGQLDKELFNVTRLIRDGQDDASSTTLPVIIDYPGTPKRSTLDSRAADAPGVEQRTALTSIGANAVDVTKDDARDFYADVVDDGPKATISLDRKVTASLDVSVPQIGAPEVWQRGYDGTGVSVAVLDSGIDFNHPDLAGKVTASKSFIDGQAVQDGGGHGTHVASTIAGSGAASGGKYRGVAPGASLIIGKVLDNSGNGYESGVIAGAQWAVAQGADIVNLSLGAETDEASDPLTDAIDELTASSGTLFVIAAGNTGPASATIGSPGTAPSALTVGAVDDHDALASFSSRGPTVSGAIKPEITAPGVDIVAARAAGTRMGSPVNDYYTSLSGTSMATPHVAGAAALLAQQHPGWRAGVLKDALVSTAKPDDSSNVYQQGGGRVAVDRASESTVFASATADFGDLFGDQSRQSRQVTYTNIGTAPVTLALALDLDRGDDVPAGVVSLSDTTLVVPAGGTASTTITVDPSVRAFGRYDGYLTASANGVSLSTAVGYVVQPPRRTVDFTLTGRDGKAAGQTTLQIVDVQSKEPVIRGGHLLGEGTYRAVLPEGHYAVQAILTTYDSTRRIIANDFYAEPELVVDSDETLSLDARDAKPLGAMVTDESRPLIDGPIKVLATRTRPDGYTASIGDAVDLSDRTTKYGVVPSTTSAEQGTFDLTVQRELRDPVLSGSWTSRTGDAAGQLPLLTPTILKRFEGERQLSAVDVGAGANQNYAGLDVTDKLAVVHLVNGNGYLVSQAAAAAAHGAAALLAVSDAPGVTLVQDNGQSKLPVMALSYDASKPLLAAMDRGPVDVTLQGRLGSRFTYHLPYHASGKIPSDPVARTTTGDFAKLVNTYYADGPGRLAGDSTFAVYPWLPQNSFGSADLHWAPGTRTDFVYAKNAQYLQHVNTSLLSPTYFREKTRTFQAGHTYRRDWGRAPMHPSVPQLITCPLCRSDHGASVLIAPFGDSDPTHYGADGAKGSISYYRDGVQRTTDSFFVPEEAAYRIDYHEQRNLTAVDTLGSTIDTSFAFRSARPADGLTAPDCQSVWPGARDCDVLPMIFIGYDVPVDQDNSARAGRAFPFDVTASRPAGYVGPGVDDIRVEVSYDDGATWSKAQQTGAPQRGSTHVIARHPSLAQTSGYVSLRVTARDGVGNQTVQTILRAYALKG